MLGGAGLAVAGQAASIIFRACSDFLQEKVTKTGFDYRVHNLDILAHHLVWDCIYALYFAQTYLWSAHMYHWRR